MTVIYVDFKARRIMNEKPVSAVPVPSPLAVATQVASSASHYTGSKYDRNMSCKEIAAKLRTELKQDFKDWKFSVHSDYNHVDVRITQIPAYVPLYNPKWVEEERACKWDSGTGTARYSAQVREVMDHINAWLYEYNYDKSDIQSDYFEVKFYSTVDICYKFEQTRMHERG